MISGHLALFTFSIRYLVAEKSLFRDGSSEEVRIDGKMNMTMVKEIAKTKFRHSYSLINELLVVILHYSIRRLSISGGRDVQAKTRFRRFH